MARLKNNNHRPIHRTPVFKGLCIGCALVLAICLVVLAIFPAREVQLLTYPGVLLYDNGKDAAACTVRIEGTYESYLLGTGDSRFTGTIYLDDAPIFTELDVTFPEGHAHLEDAVLADGLAWLVAELTVLDTPCLLVCPAQDGATAAQKLPGLLADCNFSERTTVYLP